jgi:phospholipid-binding lipoprotein MlaA
MHRPTFCSRPARGRPRLALAALCAALPLAAASAASTPHDPLEKLNRATYAFNDALDRMLARPAARAYRKVVPEPVRTALGNFVANLNYPVVMVNDALQAKFKDAGSDVVRLVLNTTIGIGGLFDPATKMGFAAHDEDFGQTLGHWGVPPGPYLVLPLVGPSDFRDAPARYVDTYATPYTYVKSKKTEYALYGLTLLDRRVALLSADSAVRNAYDPYVFVRNAYVAHREYLVRDGNVPDEDLDDPGSALMPPVPPLPSLAPSPALVASAAGDLGGAGAAGGAPEETAPATADAPAER